LESGVPAKVIFPIRAPGGILIGATQRYWLTHAVFSLKSNVGIATSLVFAILLWGGNNVGTKFLVTSWPPIWTGGTRFLAAGGLMLALLRWTTWLGSRHESNRELNLRLWLRGGLSLAVYIVAFNCALRYTSAARVALYLGAAPVWALLWEGVPRRNWRTVQRYGAALLALTGVGVLVAPKLTTDGDFSQLKGDLLGLLASLIWTHYGRQCRAFGSHLSGVEISAHTMWRAGVWLLPVGLIEVARQPLPLTAKLFSVQAYCIVAGGVIAFALWSNSLRHWPASRVLLFNNLIPISTMLWAYFFLGEKVTPTFWLAMLLVVAGVLLGQWKLQAPGSNHAKAPEL
jgi:drug/metabolite transporter (DMT)-like permease